MHFNPLDKKLNGKLGAACLLLAAWLYPGALLAQDACGPLAPPGQFGPFDYTSAEDRVNLGVVETHHFGADVQKLKPGSDIDTGGHLDYILRAFPNHHRALERMMAYSLQTKSSQPRGAKYTMMCYFERAVRMQPVDGIAYMLFGNYLAKMNKPQEALGKYQEAVRLLPDNGNVNYNLGLFYFDQKEFELSYQHAKKAYELGFPLPGLKNKLQKIGKWSEG